MTIVYWRKWSMPNKIAFKYNARYIADAIDISYLKFEFLSKLFCFAIKVKIATTKKKLYDRLTYRKEFSILCGYCHKCS
jgi:hypothetical protein